MPKVWNRQIFHSTIPSRAPCLSFGMIDSVPVVPLEVITSSGVWSSSRSIHSSMVLQPVGVDARQVVAGQLVQPLRHQVEALVVDERSGIRLECRVRKEQRDNVVEVFEFGDAKPVGEPAHHLDALPVLTEPDRHGLAL